FKNQNVYVILGVHKWWHGAEDHRITNSPNVEERPYTQTRYREAYLMADMISPWYVGAFGQSGTTSFYNDIVAPQMQLCHDQNIDFMPVLWPGFSWYNLKNNGTFEHHPRNQGALFWGQVFNAKNKFNNYNNLKHNASLYIAMFDEFDEATAIMKAASRPDMLPPNPNDAQLLRYQGVESDFYLRLVKDAREVLKGSKCPQANVPTNPSKQYASSWNQQNCNPVTARQLGKEEVAHQAEVLNIYPNPSSEFISLEFRAAVDQLDYRITDITGRIVCQERTDVGGEQSLRVDVSQLSTGNYIIELTYNGQTNARRITIR
ncbi:MAG: T9SS type A sorting domain-containing protein, partial [Marinoscillum sp.]